MINFLLFSFFNIYTFDIMIQNNFISCLKSFFQIVYFFYKNLSYKILMKNFDQLKNEDLRRFYIFLLLISGCFLSLYLYTFIKVTYKIVINLSYIISFICINKFIKKQYNLYNNKINKYGILFQLLNSKKFLFSIN